MNQVNINITGSKGSITIDLTVLPDNLAALIVLANQIVSGAGNEIEAEAALSGLDKELLILLRKGQSLQACKLKKESSLIGLREAKDYCDDLKDRFVKK